MICKWDRYAGRILTLARAENRELSDREKRSYKALRERCPGPAQCCCAQRDQSVLAVGSARS